MVKWLQDHPMRQHIHKSVIVTTTICDPEEPASFMPVSRIIGHCAMANDIVYQFNYGEDKICICVPLINKCYD